MAQYDLLLTQNTASVGVEFSEKNVNLGKGSLVSADSASVPTALHAGADGYMLVADSSETSGLKWQAVAGGHTQNTDTGTTSAVFELANAGAKIELTAISMTKFGVKVDGGSSYADIECKDAIFNKVTLSRAPVDTTDAVNKLYVDGLAAANDAMIYKGTVGTGGTIEKADLENLDTYNAGWTYRVITAGTYFSVVCEIGDLITCIVDRTGSGDIDADWTMIQANIDGAVIGPASVIGNHIAQFDGATGKLLKDGGVLGTMAAESTTNYVPRSSWTASSVLASIDADDPRAITLSSNTVLGMAGGEIDALTPAELAGVLSVTAPATKTSTGTVNQIAFDDNYIYHCIATDTWVRAAMATNW